MTLIQDVYKEYTQRRINGQDAKSVLDSLRTTIERLSKDQRTELATMLRAWEANPADIPPPPTPPAPGPTVSSPAPTPPAVTKLSPIKPIKMVETPTANRIGLMEAPQPAEKVEWVACPNCGKSSQKTEVFCYACGQLLEPFSAGDTRHFESSGGNALNSEYFGPDSVLALRVRGSGDAYEMRPQKSDHEIIVGRSTTGSAMAPDIDLGAKGGTDLGVSRLHLGIRYNSEQQSILVNDLGSANGSFLNGQRLLSKEVRVLRHGDELRLGKLVMIVSFRHPAEEG